VHLVVEAVVGVLAGGAPAARRRLSEAAADPLRVELGVVGATRGQRDAGLAELFGEQLGALLVVRSVGVERRVDLEVFLAGRPQQLLRLGDVALGLVVLAELAFLVVEALVEQETQGEFGSTTPRPSYSTWIVNSWVWASAMTRQMRSSLNFGF